MESVDDELMCRAGLANGLAGNVTPAFNMVRRLAGPACL